MQAFQEKINFVRKEDEQKLLKGLIDNKEIFRGVKKCTAFIVDKIKQKKNLVLAKNITPMDSYSHLVELCNKNNVKVYIVEDKKLFVEYLEAKKMKNDNNKEVKDFNTVCLAFSD